MSAEAAVPDAHAADATAPAVAPTASEDVPEPTAEQEKEWREEQLAAAQKHEHKDLIKFPDEKPPPPEVWEVKPKYDWEKDERGYVFEQRLEDAETHKNFGNEHFAKGEWNTALRRYRRAIYFCHFDEMQMHDFMDKHKDQAIEIQMHCKLNLVACVVKMYELEDVELPDGSVDHAVVAINEVLAGRPKQAKAHFRRGQVLMLQGDLTNAKHALGEARKLGGHGGDMGRALAKLKQLERDERERFRKLYGGKIQRVSVHQEEEAVHARYLARKAAVLWVLTPFTAPVLLLYTMASRAWHWLVGGSA